ncbi:hypothetical protein [Chondrinema litorale]|uniref:hypothetical protein n=1 Tax=Chondrinema litorale TaxID=2994555 RepID=UPI002543F8C9|nr:hypothetical protein [Chondrinema litorale]UZR93133.1 hypothetical protein OQ292_14835 [Chondrinema litorale]
MAFVKGDIIWVNSNNRDSERLKHPAVVWEDTEDESDFYGIMLTHAGPDKGYDNILMQVEHFEAGNEIVFSNTHFVNQLFIKFHEWGPFYRCGKLTESGIEFITDRLTENDPITFNNYS